MHRNYGSYLVKHFVVAVTNACTVKLAQLHELRRLELAPVIVCLLGQNRTILWRNMFSILLVNSLIELPEIKPKNLGKAINFYEHT